jgi:hypothetical protein
VNILDFMETPELCGDRFTGESREAMRAVLSGAFCIPMQGERLNLFSKLSGGRKPPTQRVRELVVIAGRRSSKTETAAAAAVYLATVGAELEGTLRKLQPGERGVISVIAVDRSQSKVAVNYIRGMFDASPTLAALVDKETTDGVELRNGVTIEVQTNSYKAVRGRTLICAVFDEACFYRSDSESASSDIELYRACVPGLATTGGMLIIISSPYWRKGLAYDKWKRHYGQNSDVLVIQGATYDFNPTIDQRIITEALSEDYEAAKSEWLGEWRDDVANFLNADVVNRSVRASPLELPFQRRHTYFSFVDAAGGGKDEFTMAIGHKEGERIVTDVLRARCGVPAEIVEEYAALMHEYYVTEATMDRYAGSWPADEFNRHGIETKISEQAKSGLYMDSLNALNSGQVELPPDETMVRQFLNLERRTRRGGGESIDHPVGGHDDRSNACAGLIAHLKTARTWDYSKLL